MTPRDLSNALDIDEDGVRSNGEARGCLLSFLEHYRDLERLAHLEIKILKKMEAVITQNFLSDSWRQWQQNNNKINREAPTGPTLPEKDLRDLL